MKNVYKHDNNVRTTAPLHNLRLQIDRLKWITSGKGRPPHQADYTIIANAIHELETILTQLNNPSRAFTVWTHQETVIQRTPDFTWYKHSPFLTIYWTKNNYVHYFMS